MKRRKRFSIRLVALGFAVTAIAAPAAQAVPTDPDTNRVESGLYYSAVDNAITSPDDRKMHATWTQQPVVDHVIKSPDDRTIHATWAPQPASAVAEDDGFFGTTSIVSGLVLLLVGGFGVALVARSVRRGRLAPT
jgi:hypothetical protein